MPCSAELKLWSKGECVFSAVDIDKINKLLHGSNGMGSVECVARESNEYLSLTSFI